MRVQVKEWRRLSKEEQLYAIECAVINNNVFIYKR